MKRWVSYISEEQPMKEEKETAKRRKKERREAIGD